MLDKYTKTLGKYAELSFTIKEPDDHIVSLLYKGDLVDTFSATGATAKHIQYACEIHLAKLDRR